jgi:hypothetical protein
MFYHGRIRSIPLLFVLAVLLSSWPAEAGPCTFDPDGGACGESLDNGCTWDPNGGGCRDHLVENGCGWDPDGGGCPDSFDNGCGWEPNGGTCLDDR